MNSPNEIVGVWCDKCKISPFGLRKGEFGLCLYNKCSFDDCDGEFVWKYRSDEEKIKKEWEESCWGDVVRKKEKIKNKIKRALKKAELLTTEK